MFFLIGHTLINSLTNSLSHIQQLLIYFFQYLNLSSKITYFLVFIIIRHFFSRLFILMVQAWGIVRARTIIQVFGSFIKEVHLHIQSVTYPFKNTRLNVLYIELIAEVRLRHMKFLSQLTYTNFSFRQDLTKFRTIHKTIIL